MISKYTVLEYFYIILGSFITAFAITAFTNPAQIAPGGVSGISTILYHAFSFDLSLTMLLQNIPLFIIGTLLFGKQFGLKSLIGAVLLSIFSSIIGRVIGYDGILDLSRDMNLWLSCLFGGVLSGLGLGLVMKSGANTGGTDIIAQIVARYLHLPMGTSIFAVDGAVIVCSAFIFGLESALYAIIVAYITQIMVNKVVLMMGTNYAKTCYIISEKLNEIRNFVLNDLDKSGTLIEAKGLYSMKNRPMLMVVIPNQSVSRLTRMVHTIDPKAFLIIQETYHVFGEGNNSMEEFVALNKDVSQEL